MREIVIGTRGSPLALQQARAIAAQVAALADGAEVRVQAIVTHGDADAEGPLVQLEGQGLFTREIEIALLAGRIHIAVHSLKDLPTELPSGLTIGAIVAREDARDAVISRRGHRLADLPPASLIGTSSLRRAAQVLAQRPDLQITPLRGNVDTRLRKLQAGACDALILAAAGLIRLGLAHRITEYLTLAEMVPAPGQGALAIEASADDYATLALLARLDHAPTRAAVMAERSFLREVGGGCHLPVAAYAMFCPNDGGLRLQGLIASADGRRLVRGAITGRADEAEQIGAALAADLLARGGKEIVGR